MSSTYTIAVIQMAMTPDPGANLATGRRLVADAVERGARVVCLPELFRTPYLCQVEDAALFDYAEPIPGPLTQALGPLAREKKAVIIAPFFERRAPGVYHNSAVVFDTDGSIAGLYRKMHIPDDPAFYEKYYFAPGDRGFMSFKTRVGRIGVLICWDQWYPEAARLTALRGAEVIFYPTAIGWHPHEKARFGVAQHDAWRTVQRGHAIANGVYVAAANRIGHETPPSGGAGIEFWGSSFISDPQGILLCEASTAREEILTATVDPARIEDVRRNWPFLRDRRIDAFADIQRRYIDETPDGNA